jgi:hypothetical protein
MNGFEVYNKCRNVKGWNSVTPETYSNSECREYYNMLADYLNDDKRLSDENICNFIKANYNKNPSAFDPYNLINSEAFDVYAEWHKSLSTTALYLDHVRKSFHFIENFCINKSIDLDQYKKTYSARHVRENKIDYAVAVHLKFIDPKQLSKVEKILLKNFIKQYNIILIRLSNPELAHTLNVLTDGMKRVLQEYKKLESQK